MRKLKLLLGIGALAASLTALTACGDEDEAATPTDDGGGTDGPGNQEGGPGFDSGIGADSGDGGPPGPTTFPAYVRSLIETKTNETGLPDKQLVWDTLADDEKYAFPTTFF